MAVSGSDPAVLINVWSWENPKHVPSVAAFVFPIFVLVGMETETGKKVSERLPQT